MDANITVGDEIATGLKEYMDTVQFKKTTLTFLASKIPENSIEKLRDAFIKIDKNGDGTLTADELQQGVSQFEKCQLTPEDFNLAMKLMDTNNNGVIDYTEFIAACMQSYGYCPDNQLKSAFEYFDKDGSGKITMEELKDVLCNDDLMQDEEEILKIIAEVDLDNDGAIDYNEFIGMMKSNSSLINLS
jgi:calcium-dependent protein kinase